MCRDQSLFYPWCRDEISNLAANLDVSKLEHLVLYNIKLQTSYIKLHPFSN